MFVLTQAPKGALSGRRCSLSPLKRFPNTSGPNPPPFSNPKPTLTSRNRRGNLNLAVTNAEGGGDSASASASKQALPSSTTRSSPSINDEIVFVGGESVPLEGVIQFEKPDVSSQLNKWGLVALLAGGDVLALLLFAAIGRFNHGFPVLDIETLRTADPFIGGWFLIAYFLGGYGEDGRRMNGMSKAVIAAAKSWALGIPLGLVIRAATSGHIPQASFALVTMGSTAFLLVGWRVLLFSILPSKSKNNEVYKRGNPFELFELLTSLVRRW